MKTTGLFTTHRAELLVELNKPVTFIPFGDVHRDSDLHAADEWREFLAYAKSKPQAVFLGMGDYTDGVSTTERVVLGGGLHDTTRQTIKDVYKGVAKTLVNELGFMRGRLIGLLGGNHYLDFGDGNTTDHLIAAGLGAKFLGVSSLIRLTLQVKGANQSAAVDIFAHHGRGGGSTPGASFNTVEKMSQTAEADIFLMGHTHAKGCMPSSPRLRLVNSMKKGALAVTERTPWLGRTGSFLKAYEPGRVSYNVDAGRSPCALGWIEFELTVSRVQAGGQDRIVVKIRGTA